VDDDGKAVTFKMIQECMDRLKNYRPRVMSAYSNFEVLGERCPVCGDNLIRNRKGIECFSGRCDYVENNNG